VTKAQWLAATDPGLLLRFLQGKVSERRLRLMLCGWARLYWKELIPQGRSAIEVAEQFADGLASDADRRQADAELLWVTREGDVPFKVWLARFALEQSSDLWAAADASVRRNPKVKSRQIAVLRDVFADPFRPLAVDPAWLSWNDGTVDQIARGVYDDRAFDRLPVLADALEEAGCRDPAILGHCRRPGAHVRGCRVLDLLLGKE
jgi:hypothetical protein